MPDKAKVVLFFLVIVFLSAVWYLDIDFLQEKTSRIFSPSKDTFISKELSSEEIKNLARIPVYVPFKKSIPAGTSLAQERLKQADNVLLYQSNPQDISGRTMLVDTNQNVHYYIMGLGGAIDSFETSASGKMVVQTDFWRETGVFRFWSPISNSQDWYLVLSDPERNQDFAIRISREKGGCFLSDRTTYLTDFLVRNISFTAERGAIDDLGTIYLWSEKDLATLIKPGDLLTVYNLQHNPLTKQIRGVFAKRDTLGVVCAEALVINRFAGKKQLEKELARSIPDVVVTSPGFADVKTLYEDPRLVRFPNLEKATMRIYY